MKNFNNILKKVATPICQRYGFVAATLLMDWHLIVGEKFAVICQPEKILFPSHKKSNGLLYVATSSAFAPELSYLEPMIVDKVNKYFGYKAVERLVIRHKKMPAPRKNQQPVKQVCDADRVRIEQQIEGIESPELKEALRKLGLGIYTHHE
ncbi:DUF721 domain-containing protein [Candidatus Paracaedibacter symbiosus]|uniref:DUF721 domain-containing protein n=1 Tax=Candidatus Paracaedibacter symbiosus TaxID=244582 RepID=UPI000691FCA7|nr:DciA family protein [Candidatus Paracaedibacter symbiosus]